MKTYTKLSFIMLATISCLFAAERQGEIKETGNRDSCGPGYIQGCGEYSDYCYPHYYLSDGYCDSFFECYEDDGLDCAGGEGGLFLTSCFTCMSMDNNMSCYDLLGQWINCFGCSQVFDECGECLGEGIPNGECDCNGNTWEDCAGECGGTAEVDACGVCNGPGYNDDGCCGDQTTDCAGECGGTAELDECGVCNGYGIADGACDCFGSVIDECGICGGDGNWCSAPIAYDATYTLTEDEMITVYLSATDAEGDALTFSIIDNSNNGVVMLDGIAATYMPDANFYGTDSFTFIVNDGLFDSNEATINLVVMAVNDAPYFSSIADAEIDLGDIFIYTLEAQDVDGDALVYQLVNVSGPGIATLAGNVLTVQADEEGEIEITVNVSDGMMTDQETFTLTVVAPACATEYEQGFFDGAATGDVNGDGLLNIVDIVLSVEMILGN